MPQEIERRFLVSDDGWRRHAVRSERLRDGLLAASDGRKVRVRLYESRATLTVKSQQEHGRRAEFEYDIPRGDAEEMLASHCGVDRIDKTRHHVPFAGLDWEVDVYEGLLAGVVVAEVELDSMDRRVELPAWVGEEVTGRPEYRKRAMLEARRADAANARRA